MNEIDEIKPSEDTLMTGHLIRIFKSVGCSPTECHACTKEIKTGEVFRLVPHPNINAWSSGDRFVDEMCCVNCGSKQLTLRDRRRRRNQKNHAAKKIAAGGHGFSRPSKL